MKLRSTLNNNNSLYTKGLRSMERIKPTNKANLSIMDEKLYLLNTDIEELYKKYLETKKQRQNKEKNEQNLVTRINFLIDEERKIRNQIENNVIKNKNEFYHKNRSVKTIKTSKAETNLEINKNNIENSDDTQVGEKYKYNNSTKENMRINFDNNFNKNGKENKSNYDNKKLTEIFKRNVMNDINMSNYIQNNIIENKDNIINKDIDNNKNEIEGIINNKNFDYQNNGFSFYGKENNINENVKVNINIKINNKNINLNNINDNINQNNNIKIKDKYNDNEKSKDNLGDYINIKYNKQKNKDINKNLYCKINNNINIENNNLNEKMFINCSEEKSNKKILNYENNDSTENKNKINNEINYIKMSLESKIKKEIIPSIPYFQANIKKLKNINQNKLNNFSEIIESGKDDNNSFISYNNLKNENLNDSINTPSFKGKKKETKKEKTKLSLKNVLILKQKKLKELEKEIELKKNKIQYRRNSSEFRRKSSNINISINLKKNKFKKYKNFNKRCYSKTENDINIKNKALKTFNHYNIKKNINIDKSVIENRKNDYNNLSIDSDEVLLSNDSVNNPLNKKRSVDNSKHKVKKFNLYKRSINLKKRVHPCDAQVNNEYDSTPNLIPNITLTFNQSIEKKREFLGLPINLKKNSKNNKIEINNKIIQKDNKFKLDNKNQKNIVSKKNKKNEGKVWNRNNISNKSSKTMCDKRKKNKNINNIKNKEYEKENKENYNNNIEKTKYLLKSNFNSNYNSIYNSNHNNLSKDNFNNELISCNSQSSLFSTKTNITNKTNKTFINNKNNDISKKSKYILSDFSIFKKYLNNPSTTKSNINKIITKNENENKDYLTAIRLIKIRKAKSNISSESLIQKEKEKKEDSILNNNNISKDSSISKINDDNNEKNLRKEISAIRRINQIKEAYKKNWPKVHQINKKQTNKLEKNENNNINKNIINISNYKSKFYRFQSFKRLYELQNRSRPTSFSDESFSIDEKKNNKSFSKINKSFKTYKF